MSRWALLLVALLALILVPFVLFEPWFEALGERIVAGGMPRGLAAVTVAGFLALDIFLPVPSSIVSTAAGALFGFGLGTLVIWLGMTLGCGLGYAVGARSSGLARRLVGEDGLRRAAAVAERYGAWGLAASRAVPVLAEASVVLAGLVRSPFPPFLVVTTLANLGIAVAYAAIGAYSMNVGSFLLTFAGAMALPALAMLAARLVMKDRAGGETTQPNQD
jgi:uncharacterized membrane protein YdjX (TVP38/TMEM64 family)